MEGSEGSPPQSLCMIRAAELFPKPQMEKEDTDLTVPFQELAGESVKYLARTDDGTLALSNYRIFLLKNTNNSETSVPLSLIESVQIRDLFHLIISCKDASTVKCSFETAEQCSEAQRRIQLSVGVPETLETLFAFPFCSWTCDGIPTTNGVENLPTSSACSVPDYLERLQRASHYEDEFFMREVERLGFDLKAPWRISQANKDFKLCASYPQKILVPSCISDDTLHKVANFRGSRRLPAVVWRHRKSGAVIARCSQPEVGWLGWRNAEDEKLLKALADACAFDRGEQMRRMPQTPAEQNNIASGESSPSSPDGSHEEVPLDEVRKVLIVDARSYTSAVTNRARGGGCECIEYYPCAEIEFMSLGNIHAIRKSFHALRQLCASPPDVPNWLTTLEKTMWFQHLSGLLAASVTVCHAVEKKGRPVLVHCSDGWDRTPQLVATAQLCLDPYYRTVEGFRVLVEREWLSFGHKFADRCGHGPGSDELNERCPVFLQWLDLVHQIHKQFPCSFEFSMGYLIKLAQHSHSCLFGTFLCNTLKERVENSVFERTFSVWPFLSGPMYKNPLYVPNREKVLWPAHNVRDLDLWTEVYLGSLGNQNCIDIPTCNAVDGSLNGSMSPVVKTRSYGDLITASILQNGMSRRSSDPNMTVDPNLTLGSNSENTSVADIQSEREDSPDIIANYIHDTTRKLENLTIELNSQDDDESLAATKNTYCLDFEKALFPEPKIQSNTSIDANDAEHQLNLTKLTTLSSITSSLDDINQLPQQQEPQQHKQEQKFGCESYIINKINDNSSKSLYSTNAEAIENNELLRQNGFSYSTIDGKSQGTNEAPSYEHLINTNGITIHKTGDISLDMMQSVDLSGGTDGYCSEMSASNYGITDTDLNIQQQNLWHGSVNTSTDTLVPIDLKQQKNNKTTTQFESECEPSDNIDGVGGSTRTRVKATTACEFSKETPISNGTASCSILPKVHNGNRMNAALAASSSSTDASVSSSASTSLNNLHKINSIENVLTKPMSYDANSTENFINHYIADDDQSSNNNAMDESILILPEHQKLDISLSGKCETIPNSVANATTQTKQTADAMLGNCTSNATNMAPPVNSAPSSSYGHAAAAYMTTVAVQRRRRTSSSNSRRDGFIAKQIYSGSTIQRYPLQGGIRSLPMTPPGLVPERSQVPISCLDGLAHALSEQNIRLQQIVHEHKLREDALLREIHDMRMALLKKICPNCNNAPATNDEQCSGLDNAENVSVCSWEAVEDRSGPSSCTSSSIQANTATSVLWVPDHAVSRCTSCQTEFWLGRRKHHCRSCGQIFCADCSEFWAPLPDEKLFSPVRLCGPCYHAVTTRMQVSASQLQSKATLLQAQPNNVERNKISLATTIHTTISTPPATTAAVVAAAAATAVVSVPNATLMTATSQA